MFSFTEKGDRITNCVLEIQYYERKKRREGLEKPINVCGF